MLPTIDWQGDVIVMVDQRKLPGEEVYVHCKTAPEVARAIKTMVMATVPIRRLRIVLPVPRLRCAARPGRW